MTTIDPIWKLPPITIHETILAAEAPTELPWHVVDYKIDSILWPLVKSVMKPITIGLVDTGVSKAHCDGGLLDNQVLKVADFTNSLRSGPWDSNGHGSHTSGIMVSKFAGIAKDCCKVVSAKCLGDSGVGYDKSIADGIRWCVAQGARIINLSLGSNTLSPDMDGALREAIQQGVIIVCAAGNDGGAVGEPGAEPYSTTVSATDRNRLIASFSSRGQQVTVCAPGVEITSLAVGNGFAVMSGTSMSAPWISAYLGCKIAYDEMHGTPTLITPEQVANWLASDSDDLGVAGRDPLYGVGAPNPAKFVQQVPPPPTPLPSVAPPEISVDDMLVTTPAYSAHYSGTLKRK